MNFDCNTSLVGQYTLYDENMNVLGETENLITDWGMRRFVGDRSTGAPHPDDSDSSQLAFVNNMRYIMLGTGSTGYGSETYSDFKLVSAVPPSDYNEVNVGATTGTTLSTHSPSNDLLISFTRLTRFEMAPSFNTTTAPTSTYNINEIGCSWSQTMEQNNRYGIFSRATLNTPILVKPNNVIYVKYNLVIRTDANQVKGSMTRFNGTGAVSLPVNKTNVREFPMFTLNTDGTSSRILNSGSGGWPGSAAYSGYLESTPLFEDAGNLNLSYTSYQNWYGSNSQDSTLGDATKKLWWLQFYTSDWSVTGSLSATSGGANPSQRYSTFVSTTTSNMSPYNLTTDNTGFNTGSSTYDIVVSQNLSPFVDIPTKAGRKKQDSETLTKVNSNTWRRTIRFLFSPNELQQKITVFNLYRATLGDWNVTMVPWTYPGIWGKIYLDSTAPHTFGIVTVLNSQYNPNLSLYDGIEYSFTYSRS